MNPDIHLDPVRRPAPPPAKVREASDGSVEANLSYLVPNGEKPKAYIPTPGTGEIKRTGRYADYRVSIHDARPIVKGLSLDHQGFALTRHETGFVDFKFHDVGDRVFDNNEQELDRRTPRWHVNTATLVGLWGVEKTREELGRLSGEAEALLEPYGDAAGTLTAIAGFTGSLFILGYQYNLGSSPLSLIMLGAFGVALSLQYRLILPFFSSIIGTLTGVGGLLTESFSQNLWLGADLSETYLIPALIVMGMAAFIPKWRTHYLGSSLYNASAIVAGFLILFFIISPAESYLPFGETANSWFYAIAGTGIGIGSVFLALKSEWLVTRHLATAFMLAVLIIKYIDLAWGKLPEFLFYLLFGLFAVGCIIILRRFRTRLKGANS